MIRTLLAAAAFLASSVLAGAPADARGCLKGAVVGGVAGHYAHHHAVLGAAAGCWYGHHRAKVAARQERMVQTSGQTGR